MSKQDFPKEKPLSPAVQAIVQQAHLSSIGRRRRVVFEKEKRELPSRDTSDRRKR
jgi:hypothetical protein